MVYRYPRRFIFLIGCAAVVWFAVPFAHSGAEDGTTGMNLVCFGLAAILFATSVYLWKFSIELKDDILIVSAFRVRNCGIGCVIGQQNEERRRAGTRRRVGFGNAEDQALTE